MTEARKGSGSGESEAIRKLLRRSGHELRNAQNAAAVNLEVVRSRVASGKANAEALKSFAENAAKGLEESAHIGEALISMCTAMASSLAGGNAKLRREGGTDLLELAMSAESGTQLVQRISALATKAGFGVESAPAGVIFRIPPDNERNRA